MGSIVPADPQACRPCSAASRPATLASPTSPSAAPPASQRLVSATPDDNRITLGCIVVAFYEAVVEPLLDRPRGVIYVLPERRPVEALFGGHEPGVAIR